MTQANTRYKRGELSYEVSERIVHTIHKKFNKAKVKRMNYSNYLKRQPPRNTVESQDPDLPNEDVEEEVPQLSGENDSHDPLARCENQYSKLFEEYQRLVAELSDRQEKHQRLMADLENMRRRSVQETERQVNRAITAFASDLLEVADSFERVLTAQDCQISEGILSIKKQVDTALEKLGITAFSSTGEQFDPAFHDAIDYVPSEKPQGTVIDEVSRGYTRNDCVIRCAKVIVSKGGDESNA